jgi:hypothetical protein
MVQGDFHGRLVRVSTLWDDHADPMDRILEVSRQKLMLEEDSRL